MSPTPLIKYTNEINNDVDNFVTPELKSENHKLVEFIIKKDGNYVYDFAQLKAQYEMLKVTMASEQPVFQILEYAEVPDQKSKPSRGMLCIIVTFAAFFVSVFLAFLLNALENIKKDPVAMAKLKKKK